MNAKNMLAIGVAAFTAGWVASAAQEDTDAPATAAATEAAAKSTAAAPVPDRADANMTPGSTLTNGLFLNFHDVPLSTILNYLSAKLGLIVISEVDVRGKVSMVGRQAITTNDLVDLLDDQLAKNKYTAMLNGRTLTIMNASSAKTSADTKIVNNANPKRIPFNDEIVTEILPLHTLDPAKLVKDLEALIPQADTVTANESGGAIIMTAPQKDLHRIAEIIYALDSVAFSDVEVFVLKFADSKSVAAELKEVFQSADSDITGNAVGARFGGGGAFPGDGGGVGGSTGESKNSQTHAVFVADDQLNAVVTSAPPDFMPGISNIINHLDQPNQDITEIRVFRLKHADPAEIADELSNFFPSTTDNSDQNGLTMGFSFGGPPEMQEQSSSASNQSERMKRKTSVVVVADRRTQFIVVTASSNLICEIKEMIADLDASSMGVQHVHALAIDSADPAVVQDAMTSLFASATSSSRNQTTTQTPLQARATGNANVQSSSAATSTSGIGTGSGSTTGPH
jgi:type II secretory pathway component GspD/PulD (secretin)